MRAFSITQAVMILTLVSIGCCSYPFCSSGGRQDDGEVSDDAIPDEVDAGTEDGFEERPEESDVYHCEVDSDGDGFISHVNCGGADCCDDGTESSPGCRQDNAAEIHPGAYEIILDGIDQDCDGVDLSHQCPDIDGDGYLDKECGGIDCDDDDARIHPGAEEICGDIIDQNCNGEDCL